MKNDAKNTKKTDYFYSHSGNGTWFLCAGWLCQKAK